MASKIFYPVPRTAIKRYTCFAVVACSLAGGALANSFPGPGGKDFSLPLTSVKQARFAATLHQKYDFSCGSAALATLLTYHYRYPVSEQVVFEDMFALGDRDKIRREGFSLLDMKQFLERRGFQADGFQQPLDSLVKAGLPAIVLIREGGYRHFVVVKGMRDQRILIGDPSTGTRVVKRKDFETMWVNQLLFVIHNKQDMAKFNVLTDWSAAPLAPLAAGVARNGLDAVTMPKFGPGDF